MATVKIVRSAPAAKKRKGPPSTPRLAVLKLDGGAALKSAGPKSGDFERALVGAAMFCGAAVAGAAWIGGSLLDARDSIASAMDGMAAEAGFEVHDVEITGAVGERADEVRAAALPQGRRSLLSADPHTVKARVEGLDWVEAARVSRNWPGEIQIEVTRRRALARWQVDGAISVIDIAGERVHGANPADYAHLPLVVGKGAGPAAAPVLAALDRSPELRRRVAAIERVGDRRFDLKLRDGPTIALPTDRAAEAVDLAARLQRDHRLLDRPIARIDLRTPGRAALSPNHSGALAHQPGA